MTYAREREFFLLHFAREFPAADFGIARRLLRLATSSQRFNEMACSIPIGDAMSRAEDRRTELARRLAKEIGAELVENGDPRGYPYFLTCPSGRTYDWGERGLGIPGRGFTAAELERMERWAR